MWLTATIPTVLSTWWARITRSRTTVAFLLFVLASYAAQTALHGVILSRYSRDSHLVSGAIDATGFQRGFPFFRHDTLKICYGIPTAHGSTCHTVSTRNHSEDITPTNNVGVQCAAGLTWLENYLHQSQSEEVVYIIFQTWLVVNSFIALLDESIPHLIVVLLAQFVDTGWIIYRIIRDDVAKGSYEEVIVNGACGHSDILGGSWQHNNYYVALGISVASLGMSILVFKLVKLYSDTTLSSIGSSPVVNRALKWRLWMRVFLQFSVFFILTSSAVWFDERRNNMIAAYSRNTLYDAGFYAVVMMVLPWTTLGTYCVTMEKRLLFLLYTFLSICLLVISGLWFGSALFLYEFEEWRFLTCVTSLANFLLVTTCILSIVCRVNFGKGLAQFLDVERALRTSGFTQDTFLRDPTRRDIREQSFISNTTELLPKPVLDISQFSSETLKQASLSIPSGESAASLHTAPLSPEGDGYQKDG